ncbi:CPBP family intramembrane metalloprotease [candidate division KSB1 bacterium]|nr:CPBP family intramembrane metalloprotease [candidate division KSB1 bacterium]NIR72565.1 CPBP family intramembrane metalloprotease [candidate division KSB1 bacterium]NIS27317.1 CPBP family intramembrane metalloprotease [candidate division KSB1 bacterium]NIT73527.1 CPBP family intramembrane metalloprotease [candidate division KSB1 bacterium]NIU28047.1 CPBP family intramembrane metalloprotease [candidate division KSB1 bacterium]
MIQNELINLLVRSAFQSEYWRLSRNPALGLLFILPLWLFYEILAYQLNRGWLGNLRTGTDYLIKKYLNCFGLHVGVVLFLLFAIIIGFIIHQWKKIRKIRQRPVYFAFMVLESLGYALILGLFVGSLTGLFLNQSRAVLDPNKAAALIINLGSGVYEEFIFRFMLISAVALLLKKIGPNEYLSYSIAVIVSSLLFSYAHHLAIFNEPLSFSSVVFRFFAGVAFSVLFIFRGYGITACTHSMYNVFLMFRL